MKTNGSIPTPAVTPKTVAEFFYNTKPTESGCWEWQRAITPQRGGYGQAYLGRKAYRAHRLAWMLVHGPIPDGLYVLHDCDNPRCVRPEPGHLSLGNQSRNLREGFSRGRPIGQPIKRVCRRGHEIAGSNLRIYKSGARVRRACRECTRINERARYHA